MSSSSSISIFACEFVERPCEHARRNVQMRRERSIGDTYRNASIRSTLDLSCVNHRLVTHLHHNRQYDIPCTIECNVAFVIRRRFPMRPVLAVLARRPMMPMLPMHIMPTTRPLLPMLPMVPTLPMCQMLTMPLMTPMLLLLQCFQYFQCLQYFQRFACFQWLPCSQCVQHVQCFHCVQCCHCLQRFQCFSASSASNASNAPRQFDSMAAALLSTKTVHAQVYEETYVPDLVGQA